MSLWAAYAMLFLAIVGEIFGTTLLKHSEQMTRLWPTIGSMASYMFAFYFLSLAMSRLPVGVAYAIWGGVGIVLITLIGTFLFRERIDLPGIVGIGLILCGTIILNTLSKAVVH